MKSWLCLCLTVLIALAAVGCQSDDVSTPSSDVTSPTTSGSPSAPTSAPTSGPEDFINVDIEKGGIPVTVDPSETYQTIEFFGGSGCWVGGAAASLSEADLDKVMDLLYDPTVGIGLTSYRYNIGGGEPMVDDDSMSVKHAFCLETSPGQYDLNNDALAVSVLRKAVERGAKVVTLFANSPPARMTVSGLTAGDLLGGSNLDPAYVNDFARYLVDIADLFVQEGIPVTYLSPINEAQHDWGNLAKGTPSQEGCHYEPAEIFTVGRAVANEMVKRGVSYKLQLADSAYWDQQASKLYRDLMNDPLLLSVSDCFSAHSYGDHITAQTKASWLSSLNKYLQNGTAIKLRQTEWCTGNSGSGGAVAMSRAIHEDFTILGCSSWEFWVNMMTDDWSLVRVSNGLYTPSTRMWALGNYSRFITGHTLIDCFCEDDNDEVFASAYLSPDGKTTTVIVTNDSFQKNRISFEGTALEGRQARVYETSLINNLLDMGVITTDHGYDLGFQSVTTFVFDND